MARKTDNPELEQIVEDIREDIKKKVILEANMNVSMKSVFQKNISSNTIEIKIISFCKGFSDP